MKARAIAVCLAALLSACVGSEAPLLPEDQGIADAALEGTWSYPDGGRIERLAVTPRGRAYIVSNLAEPAKKPLIASIHPYNETLLVLQMRSSDSNTVQYILIAKDTSRPGRAWRMRGEICDRKIADAAGLKAIKADQYSCTVTTRAQLDILLARAAASFEQEPGKLLTMMQERGP